MAGTQLDRALASRLNLLYWPGALRTGARRGSKQTRRVFTSSRPAGGLRPGRADLSVVTAHWPCEQAGTTHGTACTVRLNHFNPSVVSIFDRVPR